MTLTERKGGFTLIELLVVVAMIAVIMSALTFSVAAAQERARIEKATAEVKAVTQAVLAAENFDASKLERFESPQDLSGDNIRFLIGKGISGHSGAAPAFLLAALSSGDALCDPWGKPYQIKIHKGRAAAIGGGEAIYTGFAIPNLHRLKEGERLK